MDSSKIHEVTEECSSSESGWTTYIASPDHELDDQDDDVEDHNSMGEQENNNKQYVDEDDIDSDDSMASDASSGPSHQGNFHVGRGLHPGNKDERKIAGQKEKKKQHDDEQQIKAAKDKFGHRVNSAGKSKKK